MKTKIQITRCYLVQLLDKDGNEISCDYTFCNRDDAKKVGERLKREYEEQGAENEI